MANLRKYAGMILGSSGESRDRGMALLLERRLEEAEPLLRRALAESEAGCGPEHPEVGFDALNLATLLEEADRLEEAESLVRRALAIFEADHCLNEHPQVSCLNLLARLLERTDRRQDAEIIRGMADEIMLASLGVHPPPWKEI